MVSSNSNGPASFPVVTKLSCTYPRSFPSDSFFAVTGHLGASTG